MATQPPSGAPGQPNPIEPGGSQQPQRPTSQAMLGIGPENFESVFIMHRHDGSTAGGGVLNGPYFIKDNLGRPWKLVVSVTGALTTVKAF